MNSGRTELLAQSKDTRAVLVTFASADDKEPRRSIVIERCDRDVLGGERWSFVVEYEERGAGDEDAATFEMLARLGEEG